MPTTSATPPHKGQNVPIKITSEDGGYKAVVTPSPRLPTAWSNPDPLGWRDLTDRLLELGYHLQDIVDAFTFADPNWMGRDT
jgi:hypothetical protein